MQFYTVQQIADILQVAPKTVRKWMSAREIQFIKLPGAPVRISDENLKAFLSGCEVVGKKPVGRRRKG